MSKILNRLLFVNNGLSFGGSERVMVMLANEFCERGYEVDMLVQNATADATYKLDERVKKYEYNPNGTRGVKFVYGWFKMIRKQLKRRKYRAVISFLMANNVLTLIAGTGLSQKIIVSERNHPNVLKSGRKIFKLGEQVMYPLAHKVVLQTEYVAKLYKKSIRRKSVVIPNPVNRDMPEQYPHERREKVIVSVGRLSSQKNYPLLLNAFAKFLKKCDEYRLVIYGEGERREELKQLAQELNISAKVEFAGFVLDVDEHIRKASMFVMSSDYEGISNAMIESLAMGVPTICTDCPVGGAREMIQSGINGILTPVGDEDALAKAMIILAQNKTLANKLGDEAMTVKEKYNIEKIADMWESII